MSVEAGGVMSRERVWQRYPAFLQPRLGEDHELEPIIVIDAGISRGNGEPSGNLYKATEKVAATHV